MRIPTYFIPDFINLQRESFFDFLEKGLIEEFSKRNPITCLDRKIELFFYPEYYKLALPKRTPTRAIQQLKSYTAGLYIPVQLTNRLNRTILLSWVKVAHLPIMTKRGHFIINGAPRIIINQILRSPGIYYQQKNYEIFTDVWKQKPDIIYKRFYADLICLRGTWLRLEIDRQKRLWAVLKKGPKIPLFWFLLAFGWSKKNMSQSLIHYDRLLEIFNPKRGIVYPKPDFEKPSYLKIDTDFFHPDHFMVSKNPPLSWRYEEPYPYIETTAEARVLIYGLFYSKKNLTAASGEEAVRKRYALAGLKKLEKMLDSCLKVHKLELEKAILDYHVLEDVTYEIATFNGRSDSNSEKNSKTMQYATNLIDLTKIPEKIKHEIEKNGRRKQDSLETLLDPKMEEKIQAEFTHEDKQVSIEDVSIEDVSIEDVDSIKHVISLIVGLEVKIQELTKYKERVEKNLETFPKEIRSLKKEEIEALKLGKKWLFDRFMNFRTYDLGNQGRFGLNQKLGLSIKQTVLTPDDLLAATNYLLQVEKGFKEIDDIDHLKNRRVRSSGELIQIQFGIGLLRLEKTIRETMKKFAMELKFGKFHGGEPQIKHKLVESIQGKSHPQILSKKKKLVRMLIQTGPINGALREFFGTSPLSQFMDQINPLGEITHKRRLTSLGPGGVSRDSATIEIRGIHTTHYGRICPIETPEGKNTGLVNSLTTYARVDTNGFIESPFYKVFKGQVQKNAGMVYLSSETEERLKLATSDLNISSIGFLPNTKLPIRIKKDFAKTVRQEVHYIGISPIQMISVATTLIPFLEHNDANRALMGSNMQRQAVPLLRPERPIVGTGLEGRVVSDCGHVIQTQQSGVITYVSANKIKICSW